MAGNDGQRIYEAIAVGPLAFSGPVAMLAGCAYAVYYLGPWALVGCGVFVGFYPFSVSDDLFLLNCFMNFIIFLNI